MKKIKVMSIFGTRPEAIKMAPLVLELSRREGIESRCCVTAQHRQMLDSVLDIFGIKPDYDLDIMAPGQTLYNITTRALNGIGEVLKEAGPDIVMVHGDTSTTLAGALAAFYSKIKVGHVEAGLRTGDKYSPFPEEMNRCLTGRIADLHFCPTERNAENLRAEGIADNIFITGNTVIDAMGYTVGKAGDETPAPLRGVDLEGKRLIVMTCHRRENYGKPMEDIFTAVRETVEAHHDTVLVYPVHLSPVVRETAERILGGCGRIHLIDPVDAAEMHALMARACLILTDSGGIQEEAPALGKPVLVLRRETERPEAVEAGTVMIAGVERGAVRELAEKLLTDDAAYSRMARAVNPYGDGKACPRIADAVLWHFGMGASPPEDFYYER